MGTAGLPEREPWAVPPTAAAEWRELAARLAQVGPVPCQTGDAGAWWPERTKQKGAAAEVAIAGCRRCPASAPCLAYALAADERFGIWGGTTPEQRRARRWAADS